MSLAPSGLGIKKLHFPPQAILRFKQTLQTKQFQPPNEFHLQNTIWSVNKEDFANKTFLMVNYLV